MLKVGVVGLGHLGKHHVRILSQLNDCKLVGVYDILPERTVEFADLYNVKAFSSYTDLLTEVDVVDIVATTSFHYELAKPALENGCHIFIEKPITNTKEQAQELINIADRKGLKIQVGHIERFNPVVMKIASNVENPMFIETHRLAPFTPRGSDVPVVLDLMIHDIDLIMAFVKSKIKDIRASGVAVLTKNIDIANARLEFENGAIANVTASRISMKRERKIRFFQRNSYISVDFDNKSVSVFKLSENIYSMMPSIMSGDLDFNPLDMVNFEEIKSSENDKDALTMQLESFIESIIHNKRPVVDGNDGLAALSVALQIMDIIKE